MSTWEEKERERELQRMTRTHVCAECGAELVTPWDGAANAVVLRCGTARTHTGYRRRSDPIVQRYLGMIKTGLPGAAEELADYLAKKE